LDTGTLLNRRFIAFVASFCCALTSASAAANVPVDQIVVDATPDHVIQSFRPVEAMGSTVDKEPMGSIPSLYSNRNIHEMLGAGLGWLSYRLFTELSSQDWHWNPRGSFSAGDRGYWTSAADTNGPLINDSYQYALTHRGSTMDQGNSSSYSRIDDGDPSTYWKSNPYLTSHFTHESDAAHPQWVVVDLDRARAVDTVRITWGDPYATHYTLSYWTGDDPFGDPGNGRWIGFTNGQAIQARYIRVLMTASSNTCDKSVSVTLSLSKGGDIRNCVGYAMREIAVGTTRNGVFVDYVRHIPGQKQSPIMVSSVDPWHTAADKVPDQEQPGLDLIARSGLTRNLGGTYPVAMIYSTPDNAVNEVRYLRARGYKIRMIELGEEPDGQYITPEDDAEFYIQFARAIHKYDPTLKLGGPVFSGSNDDIQAWPDASGNVSFLNRWLAYLQSHNAMNELSFFSFEHYPFDGCEHGKNLQSDLIQEQSIMRHIVAVWRNDGLPANVPLFVTEANFSAVNFTQTPMQIEGGLWLVDYFASALQMGVSGVVYYQYEPVPLSQNKNCPADWGNLTMFVAGKDAYIRAHGAQYGAAQMLTQQWVQPGDAPHAMFHTSYTKYISAYTVRRPDGTYSVLLTNKDTVPHSVSIDFRNGTTVEHFTGTLTRASFGPAQYVWQQRGAKSAPDPDLPPAVMRVRAAASYSIPADSIVVVRGSVSQ
jgi:hypothetical protein